VRDGRTRRAAGIGRADVWPRGRPRRRRRDRAVPAGSGRLVSTAARPSRPSSAARPSRPGPSARTSPETSWPEGPKESSPTSKSTCSRSWEGLNRPSSICVGRARGSRAAHDQGQGLPRPGRRRDLRPPGQSRTPPVRPPHGGTDLRGKGSRPARPLPGRINRLLIEKARPGRTVVRLKGGDPYVFGRGGEEALALTEAGIRYQVVPGVTAAVGALAYAGIPVTHRGYNSVLTLLTGHEDPDKPESAIDWPALARSGGTLVFYMGVKNLPALTARLVENGRRPRPLPPSSAGAPRPASRSSPRPWPTWPPRPTKRAFARPVCWWSARWCPPLEAQVVRARSALRQNDSHHPLARAGERAGPETGRPGRPGTVVSHHPLPGPQGP